jgi:hypothetical protein
MHIFILSREHYYCKIDKTIVEFTIATIMWCRVNYKFNIVELIIFLSNQIKLTMQYYQYCCLLLIINFKKYIVMTTKYYPNEKL